MLIQVDHVCRTETTYIYIYEIYCCGSLCEKEPYSKQFICERDKTCLNLGLERTSQPMAQPLVEGRGSDLSVLRKIIKKPLCMNQDGGLEMGLPTNSIQLIMETRTRTKHLAVLEDVKVTSLLSLQEKNFCYFDSQRRYLAPTCFFSFQPQMAAILQMDQQMTLQATLL